MMGSIEDPENGPAVATAVFGAVAVYGVRKTSSAIYLFPSIKILRSLRSWTHMLMECVSGLPTFLRQSGLVTYTDEQKGRDHIVVVE